MILFPRKEGKPKKGIISDSTAEKLKSAEAEKQNLSKHVIDRPPTKRTDKPLKITKEMKDFSAYRKLRQERTNAKHKGRRDKRARDQAEKEK